MEACMISLLLFAAVLVFFWCTAQHYHLLVLRELEKSIARKMCMFINLFYKIWIFFCANNNRVLYKIHINRCNGQKDIFIGLLGFFRS